MGRRASLFAAGGALLGLAVGAYAAGPAVGAGPVHEIAVHAKPVPLNPADPGQQKLGRLLFLGAVVLDSPDKRFGGISGILWEEKCGRLLGVADTGSWIVLEPAEQGGRLLGVKAGWIAPLLDMQGREPVSKDAADAEELARTADGDIFVFYEQKHRAERFHGVSGCEPETLARAPVEQRLFAQTAGWPPNGGMEAATARGQSLVVISESMPAADGGRQGFEQPQTGAPVAFTWVLPAGHEPTAIDSFRDAAGRDHMLVLHRRFSPFTGVSAVITEAVLAQPPAPRMEGAPVARLAPPYTADNMEGLAVRQEAGGIFIYLVSDNNFNMLQRTILMKFQLLPE